MAVLPGTSTVEISSALMANVAAVEGGAMYVDGSLLFTGGWWPADAMSLAERVSENTAPVGADGYVATSGTLSLECTLVTAVQVFANGDGIQAPVGEPPDPCQTLSPTAGWVVDAVCDCQGAGPP